MSEKKRVTIGSLFYNNKFIMVFSIFLSFIFWVALAASGSEKQSKLISDVPITIPLSDSAKKEGLEVFSGKNIRAEVKVSGNRLAMGMINKDDIQIIASNTIDFKGNHTLELTAKKNSVLTDYEFASDVFPKIITVYADIKRQAEFKIEDEIKYVSDPAYFASATNFSSQTVKVSGPEDKISKIKRVVARASIEGVLKTTTTVTAPLVMYDSYGQIINDDMITMSVSEVDAKVPILYKKILKISPDFLNKPDGLNINASFVSITPPDMEIAGPEDIVKNLTDLKLASCDFSKINLQNTSFDLPFNLPQDCKNLSNTNTASVKINMNGMKSKYVSVTKFNFINMPADKSATSSTNIINVEVIGAASQIYNLESDNLIAEIEMKDQNSFTGNKEMPVKIKVGSNSSCWVYGDHTINVSVNKK